MAAEIHQRLMEEEKYQPADSKEKSLQMGVNKKVKKELPKKNEEKKAKGINGFSIQNCGCLNLSGRK